MKIQIITELNNIIRKKWELFLSVHPRATFFQSPAFFDFSSQTENSKPILYLCTSEKDEILGLICGVIMHNKFTYLSSRFIVYGGPIFISNKKVLSQLLTSVCSYLKRKVIYIEFRNLFDYGNEIEIFKKHKLQFKDHYSLSLNLKGITKDNVLKVFDESKRRQIKKSFNSDVNIQKAQSVAEIGDFYIILKELYRDKIGKPLVGLEFFVNFYQHRKTLGDILLIKHADKIIGGIVCPKYLNLEVCEWYICGLDHEYKSKGIYPSVMATYAGIQYAIEEGVPIFDFLGAGSPKDNYGVRNFKLKFGGKLANDGRFIRINKPLIYELASLWLKLKGLKRNTPHLSKSTPIV